MQSLKNARIIIIIVMLAIAIFLCVILFQGCGPKELPIDIPPIDETPDNNEDPAEDVVDELPRTQALAMLLVQELEGYFVSGIGTCLDNHISIPAENEGLPVIGIYYNAFKNLSQLEQVTISSSISYIDDYAFLGCANISSIVFNGNSNLRTIGNKAFSRCEKLQSFEIPSQVESLGREAFSGCYLLDLLSFPDSLYSIGKDAFLETSWLENQEEGIVYAGKVAYNYKDMLTPESEIDLILDEDSIGIADYAFAEMVSVITISIPESVRYIGARALVGCENLISINVNSSNQYFYSSNNCLVSKGWQAETLLIGCVQAVIPNSVEVISEYAFMNSKIVGSLNIPSSVIAIGKGAFKGCKYLVNVELPNSLVAVSEELFFFCESIGSIIIPKTIIEVKPGAFSGCISLKTVYIDSNNVASGLTGITAQGNIIQNAGTIYFNKLITFEYGAYISGHYEKSESEYEEYFKYVSIE